MPRIRGNIERGELNRMVLDAFLNAMRRGTNMPRQGHRNGSLSSQLPRCSQCNREMAKSGRVIAQLRENPHFYDGWTCRECIRGRPTIQTAQPTPQRVSVAAPSKLGITLDGVQAQKNIIVESYENLYVGFEFEFSLSDRSQTSDEMCRRARNALGLPQNFPISKTNGRGKKLYDYDNGNVKFSINYDTDLYKEAGLVTQIYVDGSMPCEVVTRPVLLKNLDMVKREVFDKLQAIGADCWHNGKGGLHMTFLTDSHKEISRFEPVVARNVMQFVRRFYPELVVAFGNGEGKSRGIGYRTLVPKSYVSALQSEHYSATSLRKENNNVWGIEIRIPDGTNKWEMVEQQAKFWMAVFRQCAIWARFGELNFPQSIWDKNMEKYRNMQGVGGVQMARHGEEWEGILTLLKPSLTFYGFEAKKETAAEYELKKQIVALQLEGLSKEDIVTRLGINTQEAI